MRPLTRNGRAAVIGALGFAALALVGCEAIFTFSPVSFLQTPLTNLSPDELGAFGDDALNAGDPAAMQAALDAVVDALADPDITPEEAAELSLVGGSLAIELSGVGDLLGEVLTGELGLADFADVEDAINSLDIDLDLLSDGADLMVDNVSFDPPPEGHAWTFDAFKKHSVYPVIGDRPRVVVSFGFHMPKADYREFCERVSQ